MARPAEKASSSSNIGMGRTIEFPFMLCTHCASRQKGSDAIVHGALTVPGHNGAIVHRTGTAP